MSGDFNVGPQLVKQLMVHLAMLQPLFGFACVPDERDFRNRVTTKLGVNTVESWVGRDSDKYIPGFYWLTLLSELSIKKHGIHLSALERTAKEHLVLSGGLHLFRFYEKPEDWKSAKQVAALISDEIGVFNIEKVKPWLARATNFLDVNETLADWP